MRLGHETVKLERPENLPRLVGVAVQDGNGRETGGHLGPVQIERDRLGELRPDGG